MSHSPTDASLIDRLTSEGLVDWLDPSWIASQAQHSGVTNDSDVRTMTIGTTAAMIFGGLADAGDLAEDGAFVPWPSRPGEAVLRIAIGLAARPVAEWRPGDVYWLNTTASGEARGRSAQETKRLRTGEGRRPESDSRSSTGLYEALAATAQAGEGFGPDAVFQATATVGVAHPEDRECLALGALVRLVLEAGLVPRAAGPDGEMTPWELEPAQALARLYSEGKGWDSAPYLLQVWR